MHTMMCGAGQYLHRIWQYRHFWLALAGNDLRMRYRRSILGIGWSLLNPIAMTIVLCVVFGSLFGLDVWTYGPYLLTGLAFWNFVSGVISQGCTCFLQNGPYISQEPAPLAIYPLRTVLGVGFNFLISLIVATAFSRIVHGEGSTSALLNLIPSLVLLFVLGWSLATLAAFANAYFPDTQHLSEVGLQILFYTTPIFYPPELLQGRGLMWLIQYNPLANLVHLIREPILAGNTPDTTHYAVAAATALVSVSAAVLFLVRLRNRLIFQL